MTKSKPYDATLARMAGNIAAGLVEPLLPGTVLPSPVCDQIAANAVAIAHAILARCSALQAEQETPTP